MNLEQISEQNAIYDIEGLKVSGLVSDRTLKRKWTQINSLYITGLSEVLRLRTSVKNPSNGQKYYSVTDPLVNGVKYPGTWRGALVETQESVKEQGVIIQTLNYGWATSLIDSEARLIGGENVPLEPRWIIQRQYVALDFLKIGDMIESIESTKYVTNPVIEGKTYDGPIVAPATTPSDLKWRILSSKPSRASDGSGIITQTLAKNLVQTPDELPTAILLSDDKALLSPFAHDTTSEKNVYVWEYRWIDPAYAQTLRDTISLSSDVIDAKAIKSDDGSFNIQVLTHTNTWKGTLSQEWEHQTRHPTFAANQIVNTYSHIDLDDLSGFKTTLGTATSGYKVSSIVDSTDAAGGFASIVQTQDKLFDGIVDADNGTTTEEEYLQLITDGVIRTTLWLGVPDDDLAAAMTTLSTAPSGYTVVRIGHNYSGTGSANITRTMITKGDETAEQLRIDYPSFEGERLTYHYFGLDKTTADALYVTLQTSTNADYKVDNVSIIEWRSALAVVQQLSKIMQTPSESLGHTIAKEFEWWGDGEVITKKWLSIKDADLDTMLTTLAVEPAGYSVASISHNFNGTGSADVVRVVVKQNTDGFESAIEFPTFEGERLTNIYLGLNKTTADAQYTTSQTPPIGYKVDSVTKQQGSRGTITIVQQLSKIQETPFTTSAVHQRVYTHAFGLVTRATTVYLSVPFASIDTVKDAINALANVIILNIADNDNGHGSADITYIWRTKEEAPRALGAISSVKPSQFHQEAQERLWIDINLTDKDALATAVALALAGSAPYAVAAGDTIQSVSGQDAGDKTGNIRQKLSKKPDSYTVAEYQTQVSFNPHGLKEATMLVDVNEYLEIAYADIATIFALLQTFLGDTMKGQIQVSLNGNGTFMMRGLKEGTPDWDNTTPDYVQMALENPGQIGERKHEQATGVPVAGAAAIVDAATADANYALDIIRMTERGHGEASIDKSQTKKDGVAIYVEEKPTFGSRRGTKKTVWLNVHADDLDAVWTAALTENVSGDYTLSYRVRRPKGNGFYDVENEAMDSIYYWSLNTTYYGWYNDTKIWQSYQHVHDTSDKWMCVKIVQSEYRGTSIATATTNYGDFTTDTDAKSVAPRGIGLRDGSIIYQSIKITRTYSAWKATAENGSHTTHGEWS